LHRGNYLIRPDGTIPNVRMRRPRKEEKKVGWWSWEESPFRGTREFNGLRTFMALLNNWDLKDVNTAIYDNNEAAAGRPARMYMASDLGSSFGSTNLQWKQSHIKSNLESYQRSKFIIETTPETVSFSVPGNFRFYNGTFVQYFYRRSRKWITRDIPRQDAKWLGQLLSRLSHAQISDAFRAAGYSPQEVEGFARVVERRIADLCAL